MNRIRTLSANRIRYEDLKENSVRELQRMIDFAGVMRDASILRRAAEKASFHAMQSRERRLGWDNPQWPKEKAFVRRGAVGAYFDEMPPEVLEAFMREAGPLLERLGYSAEDSYVAPCSNDALAD